ISATDDELAAATDAYLYAEASMEAVTGDARILIDCERTSASSTTELVYASKLSYTCESVDGSTAGTKDVNLTLYSYVGDEIVHEVSIIGVDSTGSFSCLDQGLPYLYGAYDSNQVKMYNVGLMVNEENEYLVEFTALFSVNALGVVSVALHGTGDALGGSTPLDDIRVLGTTRNPLIPLSSSGSTPPDPLPEATITHFDENLTLGSGTYVYSISVMFDSDNTTTDMCVVKYHPSYSMKFMETADIQAGIWTSQWFPNLGYQNTLAVRDSTLAVTDGGCSLDSTNCLVFSRKIPIITDGTTPFLAEYGFVKTEIDDNGDVDKIILVLEGSRTDEAVSGVLYVTVENAFRGDVQEIETMSTLSGNAKNSTEIKNFFNVFSAQCNANGDNASHYPAVTFIVYSTGSIEVIANVSLPHLSTSLDPGYGVDGAWPLRTDIDSLTSSLSKVYVSIPASDFSYYDPPASLYDRDLETIAMDLSAQASYSVIFSPVMYFDSYDPPTLIVNYNSCDPESLSCDHGVCSASQSNSCSCDGEWKIKTGTSVCSSRNTTVSDWTTYTNPFSYKYSMANALEVQYDEFLLKKNSYLDIVRSFVQDKRIFVRGETGSIVRVWSESPTIESGTVTPTFLPDVSLYLYDSSYDMYFTQYFSGYSFDQLSLVSSITEHIPVGIVWTSMTPDNNSTSEENQLISLKPPLPVAVGSVQESVEDTRVFYVQFFKSFTDSSTSGLGSISIGLNLFDEYEDEVGQIVFFSGLMNEDNYNEIDSMSVAVDVDPSSDSYDLFNITTSRAPGGHWFTLLNSSSVMLSLIHMDYLGNVFMFASLGTTDIPGLVFSDLSKPSFFGVSQSSISGLSLVNSSYSFVRFTPTIYSSSNLGSLGPWTGRTYCRNGVVDDTNYACDCTSSYTGSMCTESACSDSEINLCLYLAGGISEVCDVNNYMLTVDTSGYFVGLGPSQSESSTRTNGPYCRILVPKNKTLYIQGGDVSGTIFVLDSAVLGFIGRQFTYEEDDITKFSVTGHPVFQYDQGESDHTYQVVFPPDSYSSDSDDCCNTSSDMITFPAVDSANMIEYGNEYDLPFPLPVPSNFVTTVSWSIEDSDIVWCFNGIYGSTPSGAESDCPFKITGTAYGEGISSSTVSVIADIVNLSDSMEVGEMDFYVQNLDGGLEYLLKIMDNGAIIIQYSAGSSSTYSGDVSISFGSGSSSYLTIDTDTYGISSHVGQIVSFIPVLDSTTVSSAITFLPLTCVNGSVSVNDGEATCECDDRWTGDACDLCTLAYWGDELGGCETPNCNDQCSPDRCVAISNDAAICACSFSTSDDEFEDVTIPNPLSRTIFYGGAEADLELLVDNEDEIYDALRYGTTHEYVCAVVAGPSTTAILRGVSVAGTVVLSSSAQLSIEGAVFIVNGQHVLSKSLLSAAQKASLLTDMYSGIVRWNYVDEFDPYVGSPELASSFTSNSFHSACIVSNPGSYSIETDSGGDTLYDLEFTCEDSYETRIIDGSVSLVRGSYIDDVIGLIASYTSAECGEGQTSCIFDLPVWDFPLYGSSVVALQLYIGTVRLLDDNGDVIGTLTPVNAEVSAPYNIYFDTRETDSDCPCCDHRLIIQSDIETLSYKATVQISMYRTGSISLDYKVDSLTAIDGRIRPELAVSGKSPPDFEVPSETSVSVDTVSQLTGCSSVASEEDAGFEFSLNLLAASQSSSLVVPATQCSNPCVFGECEVNESDERVCACSVRFDGTYCSSCIGGWDSSGATTFIGMATTETACSTATCSFFSFCNYHGECDGDSLTGVQECLCADGYVGSSCDAATPTVECDADCENGGFCYGGTCQCPDGFGGTYCDEYECVDGCSESIGGGECDTSTGVCSCNDNFSGDTCSVYTSDESCQFGVSNGSGCTCQTNYNGTYCQCYNNCSTHGMCREWGCECEDGYSGDGCSVGEEPTIEDVSVDLDTNTITITFENAVSLSSLDDDELDFDCTLIFDADTYFGSCDLSSTGDGQRVLHERMTCSRNESGTQMIITPGYASWLAPGMVLSMSSEVVSRVTRLSADGLEVDLDRNLFPPQNPPVISPFFIQSSVCVCENGGGDDIPIEVSAIWYKGWGRAITSFSLVIEEELMDTYTNELDDLLKDNSTNIISDDPTECSSKFITDFSIPGLLLYNLKAAGHDELVISVRAYSMFSVASAELEFTIELSYEPVVTAFVTRGLEEYPYSYDFLYPIRVKESLCKGDLISNEVTFNAVDFDSTSADDDVSFPSVTPLVYKWSCVNAKANDTFTYDRPDLYATSLSLIQDVYSCSFTIKNKGNPLPIFTNSLEYEARPANLGLSVVESTDANVMISSTSVHPSESVELLIEPKHTMEYLSDSDLDTKSIQINWYVNDSDGRLTYWSDSERLAFHVPEYVAETVSFTAHGLSWVDGDSEIGFIEHIAHIVSQQGDVRVVNGEERNRGGIRVEIFGPSHIHVGAAVSIVSRLSVIDKNNNILQIEEMPEQINGIVLKWSCDSISDDDLITFSREGSLNLSRLSFTGEDTRKIISQTGGEEIQFVLSVSRDSEYDDDDSLIPIDTELPYTILVDSFLTFSRQLDLSSESLDDATTLLDGSEANPFYCDAMSYELHGSANDTCASENIKFNVDTNTIFCDQTDFVAGSMPLSTGKISFTLDPVAFPEGIPANIGMVLHSDEGNTPLIDNISQPSMDIYVPCWTVMGMSEDTSQAVSLETTLSTSGGSRVSETREIYFQRGTADLELAGTDISADIYLTAMKQSIARTALIIREARYRLLDIQVHFDSYTMSEAASRYLLRLVAMTLEIDEIFEEAIDDGLDSSSDTFSELLAAGLYSVQGIFEFAQWFSDNITDEDSLLYGQFHTPWYAQVFALLMKSLRMIVHTYTHILSALPNEGGLSANLDIVEKVFSLVSSNDLHLLSSPPSRIDQFSVVTISQLMIVLVSNLPTIENYITSQIAEHFVYTLYYFANNDMMPIQYALQLMQSTVTKLYLWDEVKSSDIPEDFDLIMGTAPLYHYFKEAITTTAGASISIDMGSLVDTDNNSVGLFDTIVYSYIYHLNESQATDFAYRYKLPNVTEEEFVAALDCYPLIIGLTDESLQAFSCQNDELCIEYTIPAIPSGNSVSENGSSLEKEETEYIIIESPTTPTIADGAIVHPGTPKYDADANVWRFKVNQSGMYAVVHRSVYIKSGFKMFLFIGGFSVVGILLILAILLIVRKAHKKHRRSHPRNNYGLLTSEGKKAVKFLHFYERKLANMKQKAEKAKTKTVDIPEEEFREIGTIENMIINLKSDLESGKYSVPQSSDIQVHEVSAGKEEEAIVKSTNLTVDGEEKGMPMQGLYGDIDDLVSVDESDSRSQGKASLESIHDSVPKQEQEIIPVTHQHSPSHSHSRRTKTHHKRKYIVEHSKK
ncbi:hypothetical protein ADUPG1_006818, partial [Aduncisulcus paluster]